ELLTAIERPYPKELRDQVLALYQSGENEIDRMGALDRALGEQLADAVLAVCKQGGLTPDQVDVIGSHGQTIRHRAPTFTLQIGSPFVIRQRTGITTIADFRPADVVEGGEGAPLAPMLHQAIFSEQGRRVAVVNLGGIANITALSGEGATPMVAGDTGPASCLMDLLVTQLSDGQELYDHNGQRAALGRVDETILEEMLQEPYTLRPFPKSTGRELYSRAYLDGFLNRTDDLSDNDRFATLAEFTVETVARAAEQLLAPHPHRMILCGGGARNGHLVNRFRQRLPDTQLADMATLAIDTDSLEAQAFGWFAVRSLLGLPSSAPGATGAERPALLGSILPGRGYGAFSTFSRRE
ncbi:MAG: anhydro-N-acetylmuramic acid kinase, partial [Magnetococcales bacterium]|nr:anhydro-N-acetylmuramic acid kinase [Magnetococcales bacterium]